MNEEARHRVLRRQIRHLEARLASLNQYHHGVEKAFEEYEAEWHQDIGVLKSIFLKKSNPVIDCDKEQHDETPIYDVPIIEGDNLENMLSADAFKETPKWAKKLFKKIAFSVHPDRLRDEESKRGGAYKLAKAKTALEDGEYGSLVSMALQMGIHSGLNDKELRDYLNKEIKRIDEDISKKETSPSWIWGESFGLHEIRCRLLRYQFGIENISLDVTDEMIIEEIAKLENSSPS